MKSIKLVIAGAALLLGAYAAASTAEDTKLLARAQQLFKPLPADAGTPERPLTPEKIELGRALFFETRLSSDGRISCASCHSASFYGAEPLALSVGPHGKVLPRNVPTIFNSALQFAQHYGGNRVDVEDQAVQALLSPFAYGNADYPAAEAKLRALPGYRAMFVKAFPGEVEPVTAKNWGVAIGAYERVLLTPAPFDRYLKGDNASLSAQAKRGLDKFMGFGCVGCHNGVNVGGQTFQKFGVKEDYWLATGSKPMEVLKGIDKGRFHDTKNEADSYMFKVQQLRNVAVTPPYFHDGSVPKLDDAVRIMGRLQLGRDLGPADVTDIVAFLESLTGETPAQFVNAPILPVTSGAH